MTEYAVQRSKWTFCEVVKINSSYSHNTHPLLLHSLNISLFITVTGVALKFIPQFLELLQLLQVLYDRIAPLYHLLTIHQHRKSGSFGENSGQLMGRGDCHYPMSKDKVLQHPFDVGTPRAFFRPVQYQHTLTL